MMSEDGRPTKKEYYIGIAKAVAQRSTCLRRRYGAVIVNNDEIVSTGYNGAPRGEPNCTNRGKCRRPNMPHNSGDYSECSAVHAEQNAMLSASRKEMLGGALYLYGEELQEGEWKAIEDPIPCPICTRMIKNSGLQRVITKEGVVIVCM